MAAAAQALAVLGLPFLRVGRESALRLDVPAGRLHAFGASFAVDEAFVVLAATLLVTAAFLLVTLLWGRVWCGWACPQTVLALLTPPRPPLHFVESGGTVRGKARSWGLLRLVAVAAVSATVAANLVWYFVSPYEFFARLAAGTLGPTIAGSWAALSVVVFLDLAFLGATFCATACPYAKLQGVLFDRATLVVAYDRRRAAECVDCGACVRACPTGIDIRGGLQVECIACAACIDACAPIMAKLRRPGNLVGYFHGDPSPPAGGPGTASPGGEDESPGSARPLRPAALALGGVTFAAAALLVAVVATRSLLDLSAVAEQAFPARRGADGRVVNVFSVALENHARSPVTVALALRAPGADVDLRPGTVGLAAGERRQVRVVASVRGVAPGRAPGELSAEARRGADVVARRTERVSIAVPPEGP